MSQIIPAQPSPLDGIPSYADAIRALTYGLSKGSERQYRHTFDLWSDFCADNGLSPQALTAPHVISFLEASDISRRTKAARLSHLRKFAQALHAAQPDNAALRSHYEQLALLKLPRDDDGGQTRDRKALAPDQVHDALRRWPDDTSLGSRNRALLGVLFYAGLRRFEAVALQWRDIDLEAGLLTVRRGKGAKERTIPIAGQRAVLLLRDWRRFIPGYVTVFPQVNKADAIGPDAPISGEAVRLICKQSGDFKPHDARRTLLTNLLTSGTALPDAQFIAGHTDGSTTMHYAIVKDANEVKGRVKLGY